MAKDKKGGRQPKKNIPSPKTANSQSPLLVTFSTHPNVRQPKSAPALLSQRSQNVSDRPQKEIVKKEPQQLQAMLGWSQKDSELGETSIEVLMFLSTVDTYNKIYGHLLVDQKFRVLYADRQAKQLLEASDKNLETKNLLEFIVKSEARDFSSRCLTSAKEASWFNCLTYSRSTIRKYSACPQLKNPTKLDYFFRYLKSIKTQVTQISIKFDGYQKWNTQFWNTKLIKTGTKTPCLLFRVACSTKIPNLEKFQFEEDDNIMKLKKAAMQRQSNKTGRKAVKIEQEIDWQDEESVGLDSEQAYSLINLPKKRKEPLKKSVKIRKSRAQVRMKDIVMKQVREYAKKVPTASWSKEIQPPKYNISRYQVIQQKPHWQHLQLDSFGPENPFERDMQLQIEDLDPQALLFQCVEQLKPQNQNQCPKLEPVPQDVRPDVADYSQFIAF